ncbi:MAG: GTP-binding protein [Bacteroidetes bacterium]|nr:GTP-binding protein [Bacteroidota bacterium]
MIKKKVCMIGSFAVGKTSLVQRYVTSIFSEKYMTTIGVKIDQKSVIHNGEDVNLILWDIHGEDDFQKIKTSYLVGASAYFLVADGTRKNTLDKLKELHNRVIETIGNVPFVVLLNKLDLIDKWEVKEKDIVSLQNQGWQVIQTSAKGGTGVEDAFKILVEKIMTV